MYRHALPTSKINSKDLFALIPRTSRGLEEAGLHVISVITGMGANWWGSRGTCPPLFYTGGHNMPCSPHFFLVEFVIGEVSKLNVTFVTFSVNTFSC